MTPTVTSQVYRRAPCRLATLPLVCKRFRRLLLDPQDRHLWSELTIVAHEFKGESAELNHLRYLGFLRSHLHQVEVATLLHDPVVRSTAYWMCSRPQSVGDDISFRFLRIVCKMMCKRTHTITVKFIAQAFMVHGSPMQVEVNSHVDGSYWESYTVPRALEHGAILLAFVPHLTRISLETGWHSSKPSVKIATFVAAFEASETSHSSRAATGSRCASQRAHGASSDLGAERGILETVTIKMQASVPKRLTKMQVHSMPIVLGVHHA